MGTKRSKTRKSPKQIDKKTAARVEDEPSIHTLEIAEPIPERTEVEHGVLIKEPPKSEAPAAASHATASVQENPPAPSNGEESVRSEEIKGADSEEEELELLTFYLAKEEYAIDIMMIQEITKLTEITPIPRTPAYIHGIVTLRGNVIPVFNMHRRLKLDPFIEKGKSRFVICQLKEGAVAIMVDEVIDVVHLKKKQLELPPSGVAANEGGFIKSIGKAKERLLILLDVEKALLMESPFLG